MRQAIKKWRRDRAVTHAISVGKEIRALEAVIADFEPDHYLSSVESVYDRLCGELAYLNRRHAKLIDYLKSTA